MSPSTASILHSRPRHVFDETGGYDVTWEFDRVDHVIQHAVERHIHGAPDVGEGVNELGCTRGREAHGGEVDGLRRVVEAVELRSKAA